MVVKWSRFQQGVVPRDGGRVRARAEQVDLNEVDLVIQNLSLLAQVQFPAVLAGRLVGRAEHFNARHEPFAEARVNLHERLPDFIVRHVDDDRRRPHGQRHGSPRRPRPRSPWTAVVAEQVHVGPDESLRDFHPEPPAELRVIRLRQARVKRFAHAGYEPIVNVRKYFRMLQERIHAREGGWHRRSPSKLLGLESLYSVIHGRGGPPRACRRWRRACQVAASSSRTAPRGSNSIPVVA